MVRERDELRAALLNERGEGEPPSDGWRFDSELCEWIRPVHDGVPTVWHSNRGVGWRWAIIEGKARTKPVETPTAREAMRAADTALAGAKS